MLGVLTAKTLLTLMTKKYAIRTTEGSWIIHILLLPNKISEDQLKLYIYMAYKYTNFFLKEGVHVILYVEEAKMKPRMFQKMFTIYNRIKTIQYFFFFFW